jgi:hypothetical protein
MGVIGTTLMVVADTEAEAYQRFTEEYMAQNIARIS